MSSVGSPTGAVAVALAIKRKKIYRAFRAANATSADNAKPLQELHIAESRMLNRLKSRGEIVGTGDGRFYLDEPVVQDTRRLRIIILASGIVIIALVWIILQMTKG
jgi:hypothetical protein